tara:strand:+ start:71 stop:331 length:261 start_codon:yes stop_codon:yes gene_type:complete
MYRTNWIKIEDRLPKQYDTVLTYGHPNNEGVGITICTHSDGIFRFWESGKENKHTITHWAELPTTPKTKKSNKIQKLKKYYKKRSN